MIGLGPAGKLAWMFAGGIFIGFGTRLANGCTSGHGIFGMSNFERPSLVSTVSFMGAGTLTTQRHLPRRCSTWARAMTALYLVLGDRSSASS